MSTRVDSIKVSAGSSIPGHVITRDLGRIRRSETAASSATATKIVTRRLKEYAAYALEANAIVNFKVRAERLLMGYRVTASGDAVQIQSRC